MEIRLNHHVFVLLTIIVISLMSLSCSNRPICVDSRLDGYWNMVLDSLVINRSAKVEFGSINFNFTCKNVELPLLQTPRVDVKGKTFLDADINEDSLKKDWSNYQKAISESNGTWELYSSKDSIKIHAPAHPFNGQYKIVFYKVKPFGQEHYLMRMSNDSTYIVCEKFFSGYADFDMLKDWEK